MNEKKETKPQSFNSASMQTRKALSAALKSSMSRKPMEKITIAELASAAGIRRQNFYYHFEDIYDLLRWTLDREAVDLLKEHDHIPEWQEGFLQLFAYLEKNRDFCLCILKSVERDQLKRFFSHEIYALIHDKVEDIGESIGIEPSELSLQQEQYMDMATHFYVHALSGIVEDWLTGKLSRSPEEIVSFLTLMFSDHARGVQTRIQKKGHQNQF